MIPSSSWGPFFTGRIHNLAGETNRASDVDLPHGSQRSNSSAVLALGRTLFFDICLSTLSPHTPHLFNVPGNTSVDVEEPVIR